MLNLPAGVLADIEIINLELLREYKEDKKGILDSAGQDARRASDQHRDSDIADGVLELPKLFEEGITVSNDDAIVQWMLFIDGKLKEVMEMLAALTIPSFIAFRYGRSVVMTTDSSKICCPATQDSLKTRKPNGLIPVSNNFTSTRFCCAPYAESRPLRSSKFFATPNLFSIILTR